MQIFQKVLLFVGIVSIFMGTERCIFSPDILECDKSENKCQLLGKYRWQDSYGVFDTIPIDTIKDVVVIDYRGPRGSREGKLLLLTTYGNKLVFIGNSGDEIEALEVQKFKILSFLKGVQERLVIKQEIGSFYLVYYIIGILMILYSCISYIMWKKAESKNKKTKQRKES